MPLPEGLLNPISGENPSGPSLRYDPVYDKIREARRADEELQLSEEAFKKDVWARTAKKSDFLLVTKLCAEVLANKSKDLQIAAWLTEALLVQERLPGLIQGLGLLRGLLENFWDTVHPEIEDGDLEMRAGPLAWVGSRLDVAVRRIPLTRSKLDWFRFQESRRVGYEADAQGNDAKMAARQAAIDEKKCTGEEFDDAVKNTGESFYRQLTSDLVAAMESAASLETLCDEKFGQSAPSFANLRKALEDLQDCVREFWKPPEETQPEPEPLAEEPAETSASEPAGSGGAATAPARKRAPSAEPTDPGEAVRSVAGLARYLRAANPASPVPYLVLRGLRWGELRASGSALDTSQLDCPPSETRQSLKKFAADGQWAEALEAAETAMSLPCGRSWLDLQRYAVRACENLGYDAVAAAIRAELRALLTDYPDLAGACLSDDTPAANAETQSWIRESILPPPPREPETVSPPPPAAAVPAANNGTAKPDVHERAQEALRAGRIQEAVEMLSAEIGQERSGRGRFYRKVQLAALCLSAKREAIAHPILAELAEEIDRRKLEEWEEPASLANALSLLYRCMEKLGYDEATKQKIYQKICRLDPVQVLAAMR